MGLHIVRAPPLISGGLLWQLAQSLTAGGLQDLPKEGQEWKGRGGLPSTQTDP